jgi:hypothetical protein
MKTAWLKKLPCSCSSSSSEFISAFADTAVLGLALDLMAVLGPLVAADCCLLFFFLLDYSLVHQSLVEVLLHVD